MKGPLERRKYIRLSSVFPVSFQFILPNQPNSRVYQGFTSNVSINGLCIEVSNLDTYAQRSLRNPQLKLRLGINMPLSSRPAQAIARIAWTKSIEGPFAQEYLIGIYYEEIERKAKKAIFAYARRVRNIPRYIAALTMVLVALTCFSLFHELKIRYENRILVAKAVELARKYTQLEQKIYRANDEEEKLEIKLKEGIAREKELQGQISGLQGAIKQTEKLQSQRFHALLTEKEQLQQALNRLGAKKVSLEEQLSGLLQEKQALTTNLSTVKQETQGLKDSTLETMHHWLKVHQVKSTGLLRSFEGDRTLKDWAFTYDQALGAQVFTIFGDYQRAKAIFDFYKVRAKKVNGGFANAYEVGRGDVAEYIEHSGPNIWLAIAIMQYTNKTEDTRYLDLARSIADWIIAIQNQDREFGIRGGPGLAWFSTEHNLDAYALFTMLQAMTGQRRYRIAAQRTLTWLRAHAYNANGSGPPINRGKGDATIATDTFSWAICSLGPATLIEEGMDPEQIIEYAEDNCAVTVEYIRPEGTKVTVCGFDFSKYTHLPRGGIVSAEWTAQVIVACKVMADYFLQNNDSQKAVVYRQKADYYLNELNKMLICSPSKTGQGQGCLPYATAANVDTGHGWRTPKGDRTGSLASTAYAIFASIGYNPLSLSR